MNCPPRDLNDCTVWIKIGSQVGEVGDCSRERNKEDLENSMTVPQKAVPVNPWSRQVLFMSAVISQKKEVLLLQKSGSKQQAETFPARAAHEACRRAQESGLISGHLTRIPLRRA
jgi:hypothetical protein